MAKISGTVQSEGKPLERAYVRCVGPSGEFVAEEYTAEDGAFVFHVAEGTWKLEVRAAGVESTSKEIEVGDQDVTETLTVG